VRDWPPAERPRERLLSQGPQSLSEAELLAVFLRIGLPGQSVLDLARGHGLTLPDADEAWLQYREAVMYGFYMWGITRRVDPPIIVQFTDRLGRAVMRHESHALLGVA